MSCRPCLTLVVFVTLSFSFSHGFDMFFIQKITFLSHHLCDEWIHLHMLSCSSRSSFFSQPKSSTRSLNQNSRTDLSSFSFFLLLFCGASCKPLTKKTN